MLRGCIAAANDRGHVVLIADSEGADELEESAVQALLSRGVDKFIYATMSTIVYQVPESLRDRRLVLMNNIDPTLDVPAVIPDDHRAGRVAAETLAAAGHTTGIWLVGRSTPDAFAARKRLAGVRAGLRASGLRLGGQVHCGWWPDESREAVTALLRAGWWETDRPTAVITMNDRAAMGVYQAMAAAGLRVPEDLSVVSFDNSDLSRWLHPTLSSMDLPYFDIGRRAVELLIDDGAEPRVHKLEMELRSRDSVAAPGAHARRPETESAQIPA
jgi:LacI family transcriptional regulator